MKSGLNLLLSLFLIPFFLTIWGCTLAQVDVDVVSERTSLENQVLGTYNALDREMLLLASVRGVDADGEIRQPPKHSREHKDAVTAMQVLSFHEDDLIAFKRLRWVGENNEGLLTPFAMDRENPPEDLRDFALRYGEEEFNAVVGESNGARDLIMTRVIETNENLTAADMPEIRRIFARLNAEKAADGTRIQGEDGNWSVKN